MKKITLLALFTLLASGCATILQPGPDRIMVTTEPEGALIRLDGIPVGHSPMLVPVNRASEGIFTIEKEGYQTVTLDRDKVVAGWVFGNIILGGVIGLAIDLITHNQGKYSEDPIFQPMVRKNATSANLDLSLACTLP